MINLNKDQKNALNVVIEALSQGEPAAIIGAACTGKSTMAAGSSVIWQPSGP